jgi:hypothetical protein
MATPTLIATPGALTANSYCTVAEADTYNDERLFTTDWTGASTADKTVALIWATRQLDTLYEWAHWPTSERDLQALQWPRTGIIDVDQSSTVDDNVIPRELKWATAEFARQLIVANRTADSDVETQGLTALGVGPISLSFKSNVTAKVVPDAVFNLIPYWWGTLRGKGITAPVKRG